MTVEERTVRHRAANKRYRLKHKEQCSAYGKAYRTTHKTPSAQRSAYMKTYLSRYYAANKDKMLAQMRAHRAANVDEARARARAHGKAAYTADPDRVRARIAKYMSSEKGRAKYRIRYARVKAARIARTRKWKEENRPHVNAANAARNSAKRLATPAWADCGAIEAMYQEAARRTCETGIQHDVDHVYPLKGRSVCGLHVAGNLQVITHIENVRKGNRFKPHIGQSQWTSSGALC